MYVVIDVYSHTLDSPSASSVLQKNSKLYGPMNALDLENSSSCWNSEGKEGASQWIQLDFGRQVQPLEIRVQFQAGFSAERCTVQAKDTNPLVNSSWVTIESLD